jgi:hypothetical protein
VAQRQLTLLEDQYLKLTERTFELSAPEGLGQKPRPELIGPVLTHLRQTLQDAVRMGFLHSSRARGRIPSCLKAAAEVHYLGHSANKEGSTLLRFEVPTLSSAAGELFEQKLFWDDGPKPEETAFELLGAALIDVRKRRRESNRFDRGMLDRVHSYRRILSRGINSIALPDAELPEIGKIDEVAISAAAELSAATPAPRRVRVTGRLDLMAASHSVVKLDIRPGVFVTAVWEGSQPLQALTDYFNRDVVLEGSGVFRASGSLLRIDADAITLAGVQDEFFRQVPSAPAVSDYQKLVRLRPGEPSPYNRILGSIPAEESDEEFAAAVQAFS